MSAADEHAAVAYARRLADACAGALGGAFAGAVLHGSLVLGDFVPGRSDIDLLVVGDLGVEAGANVCGAVATLAPDAPGRVDLRMAARATASTPSPRPLLDLHLVLRPDRGRDVEVEARNEVERDLVVELSVCRAHGRRLLGAPAAGLIGPVPDAWVLAVGRDQLRTWQAQTSDERAPYAELIALTACRVWRFAEEGTHCAKAAAAEWALARDPSLGAARAALDRRRGARASSLGDRSLQHLLSAALERVAAAKALDSVGAAG